MAKYFDKREGKYKTVPNCAAHGLVWDAREQRCKKITGLGYVNEYLDTGLYLADGGYYDGGYYSPYYEPVYYEPVYEPPPPPPPVYVELELAPNEEVFYGLPYVPEPVYEPTFGTGLYLQPGQSYEPAPMPIIEPAPVFKTEPTPIEPIPTSGFWSGQLPTGEQIATPEWPAEPDWPVMPKPETVFSEPVKMMEYDYYGDAYLLNGGGGGGNGDYGGGYYDYYDYGGGGGYYEPAYYEPIDYAPYEPIYFEYEPIAEEFYGLPWVPEEIPLAPYESVPLEPPSFEPFPIFVETPFEPPSDVTYGSPFEDTFYDYLDSYLNMGYDPATAITLAEQDRAAETITIQTQAEMPLPELPPLSFPYVPFDPWAQWMTPPIIPPIPEPIPPAPPAPKLGPCDTPDGLPGPCAGGTYHPLNDPCACVPFPPAPPAQQQQPQQPPQQQTPRPPAQQQPPRPPQQQQQPCLATHCKHPTTGQCIPTPQGYVRHPQTQVCTAQTPQASPLPIPSEAEDMFADLKKLPWWVWAGLAGVVVLTGGRR